LNAALQQKMVSNEKLALHAEADKFDSEAKASRQQEYLLTTALL